MTRDDVHAATFAAGLVCLSTMTFAFVWPLFDAGRR
jgi:hypothetical protein